MHSYKNSLYISKEYPHCCFYLSDYYCKRGYTNNQIDEVIAEIQEWVDSNSEDQPLGVWSDEESDLYDLGKILMSANLQLTFTKKKYPSAILFANEEDVIAFVLRFGIDPSYVKYGYVEQADE